ncbi:prostaglandin f synthase, partial [Trypanosoma rangeli]
MKSARMRACVLRRRFTHPTRIPISLPSPPSPPSPSPPSPSPSSPSPSSSLSTPLREDGRGSSKAYKHAKPKNYTKSKRSPFGKNNTLRNTTQERNTSHMACAPSVKLSNGVPMPQLGLGVWKSAEGEETVHAVKCAIKAGYRHVDTAAIYKNEKSVGKGIAACGVPREEIFVTTKLWNADQ